MSPRSEEYMALARARLRSARIVAAVDPSGAVSFAHYSGLNAARAALSEEDATARTHAGTWHLLHEHFVESGRIDREVTAAARRLKEPRERADYGAWLGEPEDAEAAVRAAEAFVAAIEGLAA